MSAWRRALFGGSFDPIHFGHLLVAERLRELERLDQVVFVPAARSPHKSGTEAAARHRLAMLRLAVRDHPSFTVSDLELRRPGPSYTIDTVRHYARLWATRPILLVGADSLVDLQCWREYPAMRREARIVVYARPGWEDAAAAARRLGLRYHAGVLSELSSREIRRRARNGRSLRYQMPDPVRRYLHGHGLYGAGPLESR